MKPFGGRPNHPGVVAIHDLPEDQGLMSLVMELVDGSSLAQAPPSSPTEAITVADQGHSEGSTDGLFP